MWEEGLQYNKGFKKKNYCTQCKKQAISLLEIYFTEAFIQMDKDMLNQDSWTTYDKATFQQRPKREMSESGRYGGRGNGLKVSR